MGDVGHVFMEDCPKHQNAFVVDMANKRSPY